MFDIEYSGLLLFVVYYNTDQCSNQCFSQEINVLSYKKWCTKYTFWFLFMKTIIFKTCLFRILIRLNTKKRTFPFLNRSPKSVEKQWMKSLVPDSAFNPSIAISEMQGVLRSYSNTDTYQHTYSDTGCNNYIINSRKLYTHQILINRLFWLIGK